MKSAWVFVKRTILLFIGLFVALVVWNIYNPPEDNGEVAVAPLEAPKLNEEITLSAYKDLAEAERQSLLLQVLDANAWGSEDVDIYVNCMGSMAHEKSEDLEFSEVLGWCERDRRENPDRFADYFNELDFPDLSSKASIVCQNFVDDRLKSPSTADHPFTGAKVWRMKRGRFVVKSYVDAENAFGATVRTDYHCEVIYKGDGNTLDPNSWDLTEMELSQL